MRAFTEKKQGRKPVLTIEMIAEAEKLLQQGHYVTTVANYMNISETAWYRWLQVGDEVNTTIEELDEDLSPEEVNAILEEINPNWQLYSGFSEMIKRAGAKAEMRNLEVIQKASKRTWQAAAWFLERKHKDRWGRSYENDNNAGSLNTLDKFLAALQAEANKPDDVPSGTGDNNE